MNISYIKIIFQSFYSNDPYKPALKNWSGYGLKYLLLVTVILSLFTAISWINEITKISTAKTAELFMELIISKPQLSFEENINRSINILSQIPEISVKDGTASTEVTQPYYIKDSTSGQNIAIIDTTGKTRSLENDGAELLITDTKIISKNGRKNENVMYLADIGRQYNLDEKSINDMLFIISQIPEFTFHSGKFVIGNDNLYKIYNKKHTEIAQIGNDAALSNGLEPMIAISPNEISYKTIFNKNGTTIQAADFNEQLLYDFIHSIVIIVKKIIIWGVPILALPFIILTSFILNLIMLLIYSFIGYSFIKITKMAQFEYKDVMRIAVVAITPMFFASTLLPHIIPSQGIVYFIISIGYLYYAIKSVTPQE